MAYRNKTYVCFDADTDMKKYEEMIEWKENKQIAFNFHNAHDLNNLRTGSNESTIKTKLRERFKNSKLMIVLVGNHTKHLFKFVRWEIEYALENDIPIIVANLNGKRQMDDGLCPPILKNELALHVCFNQEVLNRCMNFWGDRHSDIRLDDKKNKTKAGAHVLKEHVYQELGL